jgi:hypothetical protein
MTKKLHVSNNVLSAYKELWAVKYDLLKLSWFGLLLILIYRKCWGYTLGFLQKDYPNFFKVDYYTFHVPFDFAERIAEAGEYILYAIITVAFIRLLVLRETPSPISMLDIKKGDLWEDKVIGRFPIYIKFGRRELQYALVSIILSVIFLTLRDFVLFIDVYIPAQRAITFPGTPLANVPEYPDIPQAYKWFHLLFRTWGTHLLGAMYGAPFFLIGVYISIADKFSLSSTIELIRTMRGNLVRASFINLFLSFPWYVALFLDFQVKFLTSSAALHKTEWWFFSIFNSIVFFICHFAGVICSINVYKLLAPKDLIKDEADMVLAST